MPRVSWTSLILLPALLACGDSTGPSVLAPSYILSSVDGQVLPTGLGLPEGFLLEERTLRFVPSFDGWNAGEQTGQVTVRSRVRAPGGAVDVSQTDYNYLMREGYLTIDLCPVGAFCIAIVAQWLGGPLVDGVLILTEMMGGRVGPTYRYHPVPARMSQASFAPF